MKYSDSLIIELPRQRVIDLFDDPDNLSKWQPGLQSFELISGSAGQPGARSRLVYDMGGRVVEMIETVEKRNLPDEFSGTYEANGVWNRVRNLFHESGPNQTRWELETEFRFSGYMRILSVFMRGSFPKETKKNMVAFKTFAESA